jgi:hypothetical protein
MEYHNFNMCYSFWYRVIFAFFMLGLILSIMRLIVWAIHIHWAMRRAQYFGAAPFLKWVGKNMFFAATAPWWIVKARYETHKKTKADKQTVGVKTIASMAILLLPGVLGACPVSKSPPLPTAMAGKVVPLSSENVTTCIGNNCTLSLNSNFVMTLGGGEQSKWILGNADTLNLTGGVAGKISPITLTTKVETFGTNLGMDYQSSAGDVDWEHGSYHHCASGSPDEWCNKSSGNCLDTVDQVPGPPYVQRRVCGCAGCGCASCNQAYLTTGYGYTWQSTDVKQWAHAYNIGAMSVQASISMWLESDGKTSYQCEDILVNGLHTIKFETHVGEIEFSILTAETPPQPDVPETVVLVNAANPIYSKRCKKDWCSLYGTVSSKALGKFGTPFALQSDGVPVSHTKAAVEPADWPEACYEKSHTGCGDWEFPDLGFEAMSWAMGYPDFPKRLALQGTLQETVSDAQDGSTRRPIYTAELLASGDYTATITISGENIKAVATFEEPTPSCKHPFQIDAVSSANIASTVTIECTSIDVPGLVDVTMTGTYLQTYQGTCALDKGKYTKCVFHPFIVGHDGTMTAVVSGKVDWTGTSDFTAKIDFSNPNLHHHETAMSNTDGHHRADVDAKSCSILAGIGGAMGMGIGKGMKSCIGGLIMTVILYLLMMFIIGILIYKFIDYATDKGWIRNRKTEVNIKMTSADSSGPDEVVVRSPVARRRFVVKK